jgi:segregation and condensation protein A
MEVEKLTEAMIDFIIKEKRKYTVVRRDKLSIKEKLQFLKSFLKEGEKSDFETLLDKDGGKTVDNTVITFISLLELARLKRLTVFQNEGFGTIYVQVIKSLEDFDVESANGFDEEDGNNTPSEEELKATIDEAASVIQ